MEQELFEGLHKNRRWALEAVCQENLCRSWYLSYQLAGDAAGAASLLFSAWRSPGRPEKRQRGPRGGLSRAAFPKALGPVPAGRPARHPL